MADIGGGLAGEVIVESEFKHQNVKTEQGKLNTVT